MSKSSALRLAATAASLLLVASSSQAQSSGVCPEEPALQNWTGGGTVVCPCFVAGEEAGAVLNIPPAHLPAEILRVGIGWGSQFGGGPNTLEDSIVIYEGGLPNPGSPVFTLSGPQLTDGVINEYDLEPLPGEVIVNSSQVTVTLRFLNNSSILSPSLVHDGNGCQSGKNVVKAIPGGWNDACALGVSGDWLTHIVYRPTNCGGPGQTYCVSSVNSTGVGASIGYIGSTSLGANDLVLTCTGGPVGSPGLFFYGPNQIQTPFGDGFRCVGGQILRIQPPGTFDVFGNVAKVVDNTQAPMNAGSGAWLAGSTWNLQYWYRDIPAGNTGFNLSNGLSLTFTP